MFQSNKVRPSSADDVRRIQQPGIDANKNLPPGFILKTKPQSGQVYRTISTQYSREDILDHDENNLHSFVHRSNVPPGGSLSRAKPPYSRSSRILTLYETSMASIGSEDQETPELRYSDPELDESESGSIESYSDVSVNSIGCQTTEAPVQQVTVTQQGSKTQVNVKNVHCETDWWMAFTNEASPLHQMYDAQPMYHSLVEIENLPQYTAHPKTPKLHEIEFTRNERKAVFYLRTYQVGLASLLIVSGIIVFIAILKIMNYTEYLSAFLRVEARGFVFILFGTFHPILTGIYCLCTTFRLDMLRPYYLRTGLGLICPFMYFVILACLGEQLHRNFPNHLSDLMNAYETSHSAKSAWDSTQSEFKCCGLNGPNDWDLEKLKPKSCCRLRLGRRSPVCVSKSEYWSTGCLEKVQKTHLTAFIFLGIMTVLQFAVEVSLVFLAKAFHNRIKHTLHVKQSLLKILVGPMSSLCESTKDSEVDPLKLAKYPTSATESEDEKEHDIKTKPPKLTHIQYYTK